MEKLIILGSGCAGLTAAIYAARAGTEPLVIMGNTYGGLLTKTGKVENFPGFPEGIGGVELVQRMKAQAEYFGARFRSGHAARLILDAGHQQVLLDGGSEALLSKAVIIATGAEPRWLGIPAERKFIGRGVSSCATCDGAFYRGRTVCIVGGGDSAVGDAVTLAYLADTVHLIHWRDSLTASKILQNRAFQLKNIVFHWNTEVTDMAGQDFLQSVHLKNNVTGEESDLACDGCFIALGHVPGTDIVRGQLPLTPVGCIERICGTSMTDIPGVFAAGDCADCSYRQAITAASMGCIAAMDATRFLESE